MTDLSIIDKLILIAKQQIKVIVTFFILTLFIAFCPDPISSKIGISLLPEPVRIINGIVLAFTAILLLVNVGETFWKRKNRKRARLEKKQLLDRLEKLTDDPCFYPDICFNKEKCANWANNVEVLLKGNSAQYYDWVAHRKTLFQTNDLFDGMGYLIDRMKNILSLAIEEIRKDINNKGT